MMPHSTSSPSSTSKRSACDRCRGQKLRCPPRESTTDTCNRCSRAGVVCFTSSTKPLGRKTKAIPSSSSSSSTKAAISNMDNNSSSSNNNNNTVRNTTASPPSAGSSRLEPPPHRATSMVSSGSSNAFTSSPESHSGTMANSVLPLPSTWPWISHLPGEHDIGLAATPAATSSSSTTTTATTTSTQPLPINMSEVSSADFGPRTYILQGNDAAAFSHNSAGLGPEMVEDLFNDYDDFSSFHLSSPMLSDYMQNPKNAMYQFQNHSLQGSQSINSDFRCDVRLSKLGLTISLQLEAHHNRIHTTGLASHELDVRDDLSRDVFLTEALSIVSEYLEITQEYATPEHTYHPGTVTALNLLSIYLQLVVLYDIILRSVCDKLSDANLSHLSLQSLPGSWLAGFSANQGELHSKILIQVVSHQFEAIENALGLPQSLCVSSRAEPLGGLFDTPRLRNIVIAIIGDNIQGLRTVNSMRGNLKRAQQILEI